MKKALFGLMCCSAVLVFNACNDSEDEKTDENNVCSSVACTNGTCEVKSDGTAFCKCNTGFTNSSALVCVANNGNNGGNGENGGGNNGGNGENGGGNNQNVTSCEGVTCSGHGTCSIVGDVAKCSCEDGYTVSGLECLGNSSSQLVTAEDWARARIAGTVSTEEAFNAIAYSGGFPVITDDNTIIFMHWYNDGNWSVAGDFNNWSPEAMTHDNDIWYIEVPMPGNAAEKGYYKFVNNGTDYVADPWSLRYTYTEDVEISYITQPKAAHLMRWNDFKSPQGLKPRTVRAYIPENFDASQAHDVLYAHDGQNLFGPGGTYGSWDLDDAMAAFKANFIIIAMDNTEDRMSEYVHVDDSINDAGFGSYVALGPKYAEFVNNTVRPFVESRFKTTNKRGLMGSSLGGLITLYTALKYPNEYRVALALSPTTAWGRFGNDNGTTIEDLYVEAGHQNTIIYLDNGGNATDQCSPLNSMLAKTDEYYNDNYCYTRHFVDTMANSVGYTWNKDLFHYYDEGALHNEQAWSKRINNPETSPLRIFIEVE